MNRLTEIPVVLAGAPRLCALIALLLLAAVYDYRSLRIPNWLTAGGLALGTVWTMAAPPTGATWAFPVFGILFGFGAMLPVYLLGAVGAGDVKLMAMTGSFLGWHDSLLAILASFIVGGFAAIALAAAGDSLGRLFRNTRQLLYHLALSAVLGHRTEVRLPTYQSAGRLAFGVSIATASICCVIARQLAFI